MDRLKKYNREYVKASSLLESVIAITIIATCLLIGIRLYSSVLNTSDSKEDISIKFKVNQLHIKTIQTMDLEAEVFHFKRYTVQKKVTRFEGLEKLHKITYEVQTSVDTVQYIYLVRDTLSL